MTDDAWPLEADFSDIRPMTPEERNAAKERHEKNGWRKCVSCGNASKATWCGFCLEEE
jgi:hypothetical protein